METYKVLVQYVKDEDSNSFILDLPVIKGTNGDNVIFQSKNLPEKLSFLKNSNLMFPLHEVDRYVLEKADKIIKYCESEFNNFIKKSIESISDTIESFDHGLELAIKLDYTKNKTGNIHVNDITFLDAASLSQVNTMNDGINKKITLISEKDVNCHYHPGGFNKALKNALFSPVDTISSFYSGGENALISYDQDTLKLWFYYTIYENGHIISIAPEMTVTDNDSKKLSDEIIIYPKMLFTKRENKVLTVSDFNGSTLDNLLFKIMYL